MARRVSSASGGISKDDIEKMVKDAAEHEAEDKRRRDEVETRNRADQLCYSVEKSLADAKDKLPADKVADIEARVKSLRSAIEKQDAAEIKTGMESLEKTMHEIASVAYQAAGGAPGGPGAPGGEAGAAGGTTGEKKKDDVIDAEFEDAN